MKWVTLILTLLCGCGFPPPEGWVRFDEQPENQAMIQYVEDAVTGYMGIKPEWYEIWIPETDMALTEKACYGGQCCNKFGRIIIHADTDEYVCQQLVHEMYHSATYAQHKGWYIEPDTAYNAFMSETCRVYGGW
jgi:hypothetical protein